MQFCIDHNLEPNRLVLGLGAHFDLFELCAGMTNPEFYVRDRVCMGMEIYLDASKPDDFIEAEITTTPGT